MMASLMAQKADEHLSKDSRPSTYVSRLRYVSDDSGGKASVPVVFAGTKHPRVQAHPVPPVLPTGQPPLEPESWSMELVAHF